MVKYVGPTTGLKYPKRYMSLTYHRDFQTTTTECQVVYVSPRRTEVVKGNKSPRGESL